MMKKIFYLLLIFFFVFLLSGCKEDLPQPDTSNDTPIEEPKEPEGPIEELDEPKEPEVPIEEPKEKDPSEMTDEEFEEYLQQLKDNEQKLMEEIIATFNETIPSETAVDLRLPNRVGNNNIIIIWNSNNPTAITGTGIIVRKTYDQIVTLSATLRGSYITMTYTKDVIINKIVLKSLNKDKLTFAYLYSDTFSSFLEGDFAKIDVINLCFAEITAGKINVNTVKRINEIMVARSAGIRVVLSIGGWGTDGFSDAVLTSASRKVFIDSIIDAIEQYEFDGIDLDWEYPARGVAGIKYRPEDKTNFTLFCQELREAFDAYNPELLLTAAVPGGLPHLYEVNKLNGCLNYLHLMSYDLSKQGVTSHHTALHPSTNTYSSASQAVEAYAKAGFDKSRMTIGCAFYGFKSTVVDPSATANGMNVAYTSPKGNISYTYIVNNILSTGTFIEYYDEQAMAYWLYDGTTFISYENIKSINSKCDYAKKAGIAGVMFWDYNNDETGTLLNTIYNNFSRNGG